MNLKGNNQGGERKRWADRKRRHRGGNGRRWTEILEGITGGMGGKEETWGLVSGGLVSPLWSSFYYPIASDGPSRASFHRVHSLTPCWRFLPNQNKPQFTYKLGVWPGPLQTKRPAAGKSGSSHHQHPRHYKALEEEVGGELG